MNERLSPKNEPPTTKAVTRGSDRSAACEMPAAIGVSATIVPTLVPMETETRHEARNSPASTILPGNTRSVSPTVASMLPISFAAAANAPAITKIQSMSIMFSVAAPRLKVCMRAVSDAALGEVAIAKTLAIKKATVIGTL